MALFKEKEDGLSIEEWVNELIIQASNQKATDMHFDPYEGKLYIRFRIEGKLTPVSEQVMEVYDRISGRLKVLGGLNISENRKPQDGHGQIIDRDGKKIEFRVSTIPSIYGEAIVIRFNDQSKSIYENFEAMGMTPEEAELMRFTISRPYGMVLVTGPAGSGKTSTLYTSLNYLRSPEKNIITLEDPVEFHLEHIRHCQINPELGFTFAEGMKSVLRQDPDVIFIGEIRDHETAEIAVRAALSGRFVLSDISTSDATGTITRFLELGIPRSFLASSLLLAVSRRMLRQNCPNCSASYQPSKKFLDEAGITDISGTNFKKGVGCDNCDHQGYLGRVSIFEFFIITREIATLITEGATAKELIEKAKEQGLVTLREKAIKLAANGTVTLEDAIYIT